VVFLETEAFLTRLKEETFAEFEEKLFEFVDDRGFKFVFRVTGLLEEFKKL
jgi:hypothetical protein